MDQTPYEVRIASLLFIIFWAAVVVFIIFAARYFPSLQAFRGRMLARWKAAAVIAGLFIFGMGLGGRSFFNPYAIAVFCQPLWDWHSLRTWTLSRFRYPLQFPTERASFVKSCSHCFSLYWLSCRPLSLERSGWISGSRSLARTTSHNKHKVCCLPING